MSAPRITPAAAAFLVLTPALLLFGRERMLRDPGTFWHTVVGQEIIETRSLPRVDHFTFTHAGRPWIAQQWLAEMGMAVLHRLGGLDALLLASGCLLAAVFAFGFGRLMREGISLPVAGLIVAIVIGASSFHFLVRPHLITIVFSALLYALVCDVENGRASPRRLWWIVPGLIFWTNLHGGALGGIATVVAWSVLHSIRNPPSAIRNLSLAGLSLLTPLVNPYGLALPRVWLSLMRSDVLPRMIQEHAPPSLAAPETWMLALLAVIYVTALWLANPARRKPAHYLPLIWAALTVTRIRHGPIFAMMTPIALADLLPGSRIDSWLRARGSDLLSPLTDEAPWFGKRLSMPLVAAIVFAMGLLLQRGGVRVPLIGKGWARLDPTYWPTGELAALRAQLAADAPNENMFNETLFGGFITYFAPQARTFIDDRCELMGDDGLTQYATLAAHPDRLANMLRRHDVHIALVAPGSAFDRWFAQHWSLRAKSAAARLYVREAVAAQASR